MNKAVEQAIREASRYGILPIAYTESEGGDFARKPINEVEHVHSIFFDNGQRWDEINGWNVFVKGRFDFIENIRRIRNL